MEQKFSPMQQAEKELPRRFYDLPPKIFYLLSLSTIVLYSSIYTFLIPQSPVYLNIISSSLTIIGIIADRKGTIDFNDSAEVALKEGVIGKYGEANPVVSDIKSSEQFVKSKRVKFIDLGETILSTLNPGFGFPFSAFKIIAGLNNYTEARRLKRAVEIKLASNPNN